LDNAGKTVSYTDPVEIDAVEHGQSIAELAADINAGKVETLIILGGNPVYDAPVDLDFRAALDKLLRESGERQEALREGQQGPPPQVTIQLSSSHNDTTDYCHWHVPGTHYLEAWSDARAHDGTVSIVQPMILPLYEGKSAHEIVAIFT